MNKNNDQTPVFAKTIINELLVEIFNHILNIEGENLHAKGVELSMNEVHILEAINNSEVATMGNIAKNLRITTGTLTAAIDKLVLKNYVARYNDEADRRKVFIKLTEQAKEIVALHDEFHNEMIDNILTDLKIENDQTLIKALENLSNYFKNQYNK